LPGRNIALQRHPHIIRHLLIKDKSLKHPLIELKTLSGATYEGFRTIECEREIEPYGFINKTTHCQAVRYDWISVSWPAQSLSPDNTDVQKQEDY